MDHGSGKVIKIPLMIIVYDASMCLDNLGPSLPKRIEEKCVGFTVHQQSLIQTHLKLKEPL